MIDHYPPEYWHSRAQDMRKLARMITLVKDKRTLLKMAEDYDRQAMAAEGRLRIASHRS
jgi:hypothetical protein